VGGMMSDLIKAVNQLRTAISLYSEFAPNECITEIRMKPLAFSCVRHVLYRELQSSGNFFATNLNNSTLPCGDSFEIYGIKFVIDKNRR
jgi:hypothetical protein